MLQRKIKQAEHLPIQLTTGRVDLVIPKTLVWTGLGVLESWCFLWMWSPGLQSKLSAWGKEKGRWRGKHRHESKWAARFSRAVLNLDYTMEPCGRFKSH